jgi:hypothetical protein
MSYFILKFEKTGSRSSEQAMIQSENVLLARDKADDVAEAGGGGKAILRLFNETGLVATRTEQGLWSA